MASLHEFFTETQHADLLVPIINGDSKISLRVIDWFVTNYSKKNNISYLVTEDDVLLFDPKDIDTPAHKGKKYRQFVVYLDYKLQLKGYQKKQFDPFCRRSRIHFYCGKNKEGEDRYVTTTIGQLNFFKWAISNQIIDFVEYHLKSIESDMNSCYKAVYKPTQTTSSAESSPGTTDNVFFVTEAASPPSSSSASASSSTQRRKRQQLSVSATKTLSKTNFKVMVSFD